MIDLPPMMIWLIFILWLCFYAYVPKIKSERRKPSFEKETKHLRSHGTEIHGIKINPKNINDRKKV